MSGLFGTTTKRWVSLAWLPTSSANVQRYKAICLEGRYRFGGGTKDGAYIDVLIKGYRQLESYVVRASKQGRI